MPPLEKTSTLDPFIINDDRLVTSAKALYTKLSDHDLVDVIMAWNPLKIDKADASVFDKDSFRVLDFHAADFLLVNDKIHEIDWYQLRSNSSFEEFLSCSQRLFSRSVNHASLPKPLQLASLDIQNLNALGRKKKQLEACMNALQRSGNTVHANNIKLQLALVHYDIKDQINTNKSQEEFKAIEKIKSNSKYFYSYA